jgi:hypothetical protein
MPVDREACNACQFATNRTKLPDGGVVLSCHRRCPTPAGPDRLGMWPVVTPEEWCGDFERSHNVDRSAEPELPLQ